MDYRPSQIIEDTQIEDSQFEKSSWSLTMKIKSAFDGRSACVTCGKKGDEGKETK